MKIGKDYAWWVSYSYTYEWFETEEKQWVKDEGFDEGRFCCQKKDIKAEVKKQIEEEELVGLQYRNLRIVIDDQYITTAEEI